jgi:hypothetical protein
MLNNQKGFLGIPALPILSLAAPWVYVAVGVAILAAFTATYFYGDHNGSKRVQNAWDVKTAKDILAAESKRKADVSAIANIVRENLDLQAGINSIKAQIDAKEYRNETAKFCQTAPAGSVLLTPERVRDFASIYRAGRVR